MKRHLNRREAVYEAKNVLDRHLQIIEQTKKHCFEKNINKDKFLYTMGIPMFYSSWEGFFKVSISICLRRTCVISQKTRKYSREYITVWLQREQFLSSFYKSLLGSIDLNVNQRPINNARFIALTEFQEKLSNWLEQPVNSTTNFDKLVMTFSNVNGDIAKINAQVLNLDISTLNFQPLNELLSRRNEIAHGGLLNLVEEPDASRLASYTEDLIKKFHGCVDSWLKIN